MKPYPFAPLNHFTVPFSRSFTAVLPPRIGRMHPGRSAKLGALLFGIWAQGGGRHGVFLHNRVRQGQTLHTDQTIVSRLPARLVRDNTKERCELQQKVYDVTIGHLGTKYRAPISPQRAAITHGLCRDHRGAPIRRFLFLLPFFQSALDRIFRSPEESGRHIGALTRLNLGFALRCRTEGDFVFYKVSPQGVH
jgi:hypothetical protein